MGIGSDQGCGGVGGGAVAETGKGECRSFIFQIVALRCVSQSVCLSECIARHPNRSVAGSQSMTGTPCKVESCVAKGQQRGPWKIFLDGNLHHQRTTSGVLGSPRRGKISPKLLIYWSGREDSNLRPPHPQCDALPGCATSRPASLPHGLARKAPYRQQALRWQALLTYLLRSVCCRRANVLKTGQFVLW